MLAAALAVLLAAAACSSAAPGSGPSASAASASPSAPASTAPASTAAATPSGQDADWPTYDRTADRSGVSVSSPAAGRVRSSWTVSVDGPVYAQPLIIGSEVIIATENNTVYALNESTGAVRWSRHLASPVPSGLPCGDIDPSGITGTPVADVAAGRLWFVTFTSQPTYRHTLWELNLATGQTVAQRPIDVSGSDPRSQQQRGALTLLGSRVYVPFGGLDGDCSDYKGRVAGAPTSGSGPLVSYTTPNQRQAGIWAPPGESVRDNSLYVATGNGMPFDQIDDSDSVLRLSPSLQVEDGFARPTSSRCPPMTRLSGRRRPPPVPGRPGLPGRQAGHLLGGDGTHLGGTGGELTSADVYARAASAATQVDGSTVVFSCYKSLRAIQITPGAHGAAPSLRVLWMATGNNPGPPIIAGGVVWDLSGKGATLARLPPVRRPFRVHRSDSRPGYRLPVPVRLRHPARRPRGNQSRLLPGHLSRPR